MKNARRCELRAGTGGTAIQTHHRQYSMDPDLLHKTSREGPSMDNPLDAACAFVGLTPDDLFQRIRLSATSKKVKLVDLYSAAKGDRFIPKAALRYLYRQGVPIVGLIEAQRRFMALRRKYPDEREFLPWRLDKAPKRPPKLREPRQHSHRKRVR